MQISLLSSQRSDEVAHEFMNYKKIRTDFVMSSFSASRCALRILVFEQQCIEFSCV